MESKLRNEEHQDIDQVRAILQAAFSTDAESKLVDALRANGKAIISLVAVNGEEVLGYILFSTVTTSPLVILMESDLHPLRFALMRNQKVLAPS